MKKIAAEKNYRIIKEAVMDLDADGNLVPVQVQQHLTQLWGRVNWLESKLLLVLPEEVKDTIP